MSKLTSLCIALIIAVTTNPVIAQIKKPIPNNTTTPSKLSELATLPSDIREVIELSKKYKIITATEKSQFETQSQYDARLASLQPEIKTIKLTLPPIEKFRYSAERQLLVVSLGIPWNHSIFANSPNIFNSLKTAEVQLNNQEETITCTNAYGASFSYIHKQYNNNYYDIVFTQKKEFSIENDRSWSIDDVSLLDYVYPEYKTARFKFKIPLTI
jgi:hypothetical protein